MEGFEIGKNVRSLLAIMCGNNACCVYCPFNRVYITTHSDNQEMGDTIGGKFISLQKGSHL